MGVLIILNILLFQLANITAFEGHIKYSVKDRLGNSQIDLYIGSYMVKEKWSGEYCENIRTICPSNYYDSEYNISIRTPSSSEILELEKWEISSIKKLDHSPQKWICGYLCYAIKVTYKSKIHDYGINTLEETIWLAPSLSYNRFSPPFWNSLFANHSGKIALQVERTIKTKTHDHEEYSSTMSIIAVGVDVRY